MASFACNWPWLIAGLISGWLLWQLFDMLFRRDGEAAGVRARRDLEAANTRISALQTDATAASRLLAQLRNGLDSSENDLRLKTEYAMQLSTDLVTWRTKHANITDEMSAKARALAQANADLVTCQTKAGALEGEIAQLRDEIARAQAAASSATATVSAAKYGFSPQRGGHDDLLIIEGIGPKINALLLADGIDTFAKLAAAPVDRVQAILNSAGPNFRLANPASWAQQASMCDSAQWSELRIYQDALRAGVDSSRRSATSEAAMLAAAAEFGFVPRRDGRDDLEIVEGIGPKINELLVAAGIDTFASLAKASIKRVRGILDAAGPNFRLANPASWAQQAVLCRDGKWRELRALQDSLRAGVDTSNAEPTA